MLNWMTMSGPIAPSATTPMNNTMEVDYVTMEGWDGDGYSQTVTIPAHTHGYIDPTLIDPEMIAAAIQNAYGTPPQEEMPLEVNYEGSKKVVREWLEQLEKSG